MRLFARFALVSLAIFSLALSGCGGDDNNNDTANVISKVLATPDPASLNRGTFVRITPVAQNSSGTTLTATYTFASDNENLATVTTGGEVCAGKWNEAFTVCTPATTTGAANVTISATNSSTSTAVTKAVKIFVHEIVDSVRITGQTPGTCISAVDKATVQLSATAFSNNPAVCGGTAPCAIPADTIGKFTWGISSLDAVVAGVDDTLEKQGLVTAAAPGRATITASIASVVSPPTTVTVCPVVSVDLTIKDSTDTSFAVDKSAAKTLNAVMKDSAGKTFTTGPFTWLSNSSSAVAVSGATTGITGTATGTQPGSAAIVATCTPPSCNRNMYPVYSNVIMGKTNGDSAGTVYVASTQSTTLLPIPISTGTPGTAITLPRAPNSFLMNPQGTRAILGADSGGAMILDTATAAISTISGSGKPLVFSPSGNYAVVSDVAGNSFQVLDMSSGSPVATVTAPGGATGAGFNNESTIAYIAAGNNFFIWNSGLGSSNQAGVRQVVLPSTTVDAALPVRSDAVYITGPSGVNVRAVCNFSTVDTLASSNPTMIRPIPDGSGLLALNSPNIDVIEITGTGVGCPLPAPTETINSHDLGVGSFTPRQLLITSDASKAYITSNLNSIIVFNLATSTPSTLTPSGSPTLGQAAITYDGKLLYVIGADSKVRKFDLTNNTEGTAITVDLKKSDNTAAVPDLLQIRSQ